jgi:hypothetical protein
MNGKRKNLIIKFQLGYLLSPQKNPILSVSNVLGIKMCFGYEYANKRNDVGVLIEKKLFPQQIVFSIL